VLQQSKIETNIPPWALPREDITLYIKLEKTMDFSKVVVILPDCMELKDMINVIDSNRSEDNVEVLKIWRSPSMGTDYFGLVIASKEPFQELATQPEIKIKLIEKNGYEHDHIAYARIFRPLLEIDQIPDEISLNDIDETVIPIHLKFKGFGDIAVKIEADIAGNLVSEGGLSVIDRVFQGFLREGLVDEEFKEQTDNGVKINKQAFNNMMDELKQKLKDKKYVDELLNDKELTQDTIDWLKSFNESEQEKFMNVVHGTFEGYLIKKLTDLVARSLGSNVHLDSGTKISTEIKTAFTDLNLKIRYRDLMGNEYPPLEKMVKIVDKRKEDIRVRVTIPFEIEKVDESGAYKNVQEMKIGSLV